MPRPRKHAREQVYCEFYIKPVRSISLLNVWCGGDVVVMCMLWCVRVCVCVDLICIHNCFSIIRCCPVHSFSSSFMIISIHRMPYIGLNATQRSRSVRFYLCYHTGFNHFFAWWFAHTNLHTPSHHRNNAFCILFDGVNKIAMLLSVYTNRIIWQRIPLLKIKAIAIYCEAALKLYALNRGRSLFVEIPIHSIEWIALGTLGWYYCTQTHTQRHA